jgi:hypothetical protein
MVKHRPPFVRRSVSVLDQFRTAEEQVAKRLRELKPLVAEYAPPLIRHGCPAIRKVFGDVD